MVWTKKIILWCVFSITLCRHAHTYIHTHTHTHTHTCTFTLLHTSQEYAETQQWMCWCFYQTTLYNDCLITLISYMYTQHSACLVDVLKDCSVDWMPYYTLHINTDAQPYVWVHVFTDYSRHCMPYYTHHEPKGAHHDVCIHVFSEYSCNCRPYYVHHKHKGAHHYVWRCVIRLPFWLIPLLHTSQV